MLSGLVGEERNESKQKKKLQDVKSMKPTIVFDIDDCLTIHGAFGLSKEFDRKKAQTFAKQVEKTTSLGLTPMILDFDSVSCLHFLLPHWLPCFRLILSWKWHIALFSAGFKARNVSFRNELCNLLKIKREDCPVFSREDCVQDGEVKKDKLASILHGPLKKSLAKIGLDIQHSLLIDNDFTYCHSDEWPQWILGFGDSVLLEQEIKQWYEKGTTLLQPQLQKIPCLKNSLRTMGFLDLCRSDMAKSKISLQNTVRWYLPSSEHLMKYGYWTSVREMKDFYTECEERGMNLLKISCVM